MKYRIQKATLIINDQIKKAESESFDYDSWKVQCVSLIELFLGENSQEYKSLNRPTVSFDANYGTDSEIEASRRTQIRSVCNVLRTAIDTIAIKGIYKKPKQNFLSTVSESWLIFWAGLVIFGLIPLAYSIGYWRGQQSLFTASPLTPNHISEKVANYSTDSVNYTKVK